MFNRMVGSFKISYFLGLGILALGFGCRGADSDHDVDEAAKLLPADLATYKSLGLPWTADQLKMPAAVSDEENAAPYLQSADEKLDASLMGAKSTNSHGKSLEDWEFANMDFSEVLRLTVDGSAKKTIDYHLKQDLGGVYSSYDTGRRAIYLLCYEAEQASVQQNMALCCKYLNAAQRCIQLVNSYSDLIAESIAGREDQYLCTSYEACLSNFSKNSDQLRKFNQGFELMEMSYDTDSRMKNAMFDQIEMARKYNLAPEQLRYDPSNPTGGPNWQYSDPSKVGSDGIPESARQRAYLARILEYWISAYQIVQEKKSRATLESELYRLENQTNLNKTDSYTMMAMTGYSLHPLWYSVDMANAKIRAEKLLVGCLEYRCIHKSWPTSLALIGNLNPPNSTKPYVLAARTSGATIYTVSQADAKTIAALDAGKKPRIDEKVTYTAAFFPPSNLQDRTYPF